MKPLNHLKVDKAAKILFITGLTLTIIYLGSSILMPIIFSGFIAFLLLPMSNFTEKFLGRGLSSLVSVLFACAILVSLLFATAVEFNKIATDMPNMTKSPEQMLDEPTKAIKKELRRNKSKYEAIIVNALESFKEGAKQLVEGTVSGLKETVLFFIVCPIYIFFFLLYRKNIYKFYIEYFNEECIGVGTSILNDIKNVLQQYLKGLFLVVLIVAALTTAGLLALQINMQFLSV